MQTPKFPKLWTSTYVISYSRSDNSHRIHNICFSHLVLQPKYLHYWCYFSSGFVFDIHKIRIWSFHTVALEGRKCRHELALHVNPPVPSSCSCKQIFFTQQPTSCTRPPPPLGWHEGQKAVWVICPTCTAPVGQSEGRVGTCSDTPTGAGGVRGGDGCGESELCEVQKRGNESRSEGMARTAWHLNRGFPPCTLSSLRSLCLHKGRLFNT